VSSPDPFAVLGLAPTATLAEVRAARRRLAKEIHPDLGGDDSRMREVNRAFDQAVRRLLGRPERGDPPAPPPPDPPPSPTRQPPPATAASRGEAPTPGPWVQYDEPSFTIDTLPVDAFAALERVAVALGQIVAEDPPYLLEVVLRPPYLCWCRLELLPEAGATTVMLVVAGVRHRRPPVIEEVRDLWVDTLNAG
jgi:hypothetical protein